MSAGPLAHRDRRIRRDSRPRAGRSSDTLGDRVRALGASPATLALGGLIVLAAVLRFYRLGHQGFWFDEANTALLVRFSPGKMLGLIPQTESTPPLYYCVAWVWARVFGDTEAGLRSLSALAGVAVVPVAYATARSLLSRRAGLIAAALTACNPLLIWYSQEARSYELLVLLCALTLLGVARVREDPSARRAALWAVACALALATHYYAVIAVVPEAVWLLIVHRRRRPVQVALGVVALCGLALVPLALSQNSTGHDSWIAHSPLGLRLAQILPQFLIGTGAPARTALKFLALALALTGLGLLAARTRDDERRRALAVGALAVGGFVISLAFVAAGSDALITRNILPLWLPAAICVAGGLAAGSGERGGLAARSGERAGRGRARAVGVTVTVALCVIGIVATAAIAVDRNLERPDWRGVARVLGARPAAAAPSAGRVILIQHYRTLLPLSLYLPRLAVLHGGERVREIDIVSISSPQQPLCWWGAACNLIPSAMQASYDIPGFHELWRRRIYQFTIMRLVSERPRRVTRSEVARALVTTTLRNDDLLVQRG